MEPRVQQVVLPSFWPRKQNTRGPPTDEEDIAVPVEGGGLRDVREEARREVEEDRRRHREATRADDGLRRRGGAFEMPGAMPGLAMT